MGSSRFGLKGFGKESKRFPYESPRYRGGGEFDRSVRDLCLVNRPFYPNGRQVQSISNLKESEYQVIQLGYTPICRTHRFNRHFL